MQPMIMQNGHRVVIFNVSALAALATANEAIRKLRNRAGLLPVEAVHIDAVRPLVVLRGQPPEMLLDAAAGIQSRKQGEIYLCRATAYGVDWQWKHHLPAAHAVTRLDALRLTIPDNVVAHPFFGGTALKVIGDAS